ncbi:putative RpoE family DNA-directed RNA polymerase sigma subunit [Candidatus Zixiibacteriota bacterium]|nr:putative RpoE family DNA-directed RNA polymerase sigma subunit [candidate division Zixibacteria bacterium]
MMRLIGLARSGDRAAEEELFQFLYVRFLSIAKRRIGEKDAEDLAQDACLTVLQKYKTMPSDEYLEAWAYSILRNKIGNYLQGRLLRSSHSAGEKHSKYPLAPPIGQADPFLRQVIIRCLRKLHRAYPRYMRAINLSHQGYGTEEICRRMSITPNHLYVMLNRCRNMLKECIESGRLSNG